MGSEQVHQDLGRKERLLGQMFSIHNVIVEIKKTNHTFLTVLSFQYNAMCFETDIQ